MHVITHDTPSQIADSLAAAEVQRQVEVCLLYTSDAADERSSVDLGGRRIIKKKKTRKQVKHTDGTINNESKKL